MSFLNQIKYTVFVKGFEAEEDKWSLPDAETALASDMGTGGSAGKLRNYERK